MERVWQREPSKAERIKRLLLNPIRANEPATAKMALVDRLEGTPYEIRGARQETPQHKAAFDIIELAVDMAETLLRFGASALEVETALIAVTTSYGLKAVDMDITNQAVTVNYAPAGEIPIQILRVARSWSNNFMGLIQVHELVTDVVEHKVNVTEARDRIRFINKNPKPYAPWFVNLAHGFFTACVVITLGGTTLGAVLAFFTSTLISQIIKIMKKIRLPEFYGVSICAAVTTLVALLATHLHLPISPSLVIAGGIVALLPALRLVSAVRDSITGFPVTASARALTVFLLFISLVAGISIGLVCGDIFGFQRVEVTGIYPAPNYWTHLFIVGISSMAYAITEQTARKTLMSVGLIAMIGYSTYGLMTLLGIGPRLAPAIAAVAIGLLARVLASKINTPQIVLALPALINLLPGLLIFRSTFNITVASQSTLDGMTDLFSALMIALGLAAGVVLGDYLGQPFEQKLRPQNRRR